MTSPAGSSPPSRFVLDEAAFMAALADPAPAPIATHRATFAATARKAIASIFSSSSISTTNQNQ